MPAKVARGAKWVNGGLAFADKTDGSLAMGGKYQKSSNDLANVVGGLAGQIFSASTGNGFSLSFKTSTKNDGFSMTLGGDNSGFSMGQRGMSVSSAISSLDYFANDFQTDNQGQFIANNHSSSEGMARMTYVNWGIKSGNRNAMKTSMDIINGDKTLEFGGLGKGHYGHAGVNDNVITLNSSAIDISKDTMGKAGAFTSVMAREGYLIGRNQELGVEDYLDQEMRENGLGKQLTREASGIQSQAMNDIANNMGVQFDGQWGERREQVDYAYETGDLSAFDATGRDSRSRRDISESFSAGTGDANGIDSKLEMHTGKMVDWKSGDIKYPATYWPEQLSGKYSEFLKSYKGFGKGPAIFGADYEHNMRRVFVSKFFGADENKDFKIDNKGIDEAMKDPDMRWKLAAAAGVLTYVYKIGSSYSGKPEKLRDLVKILLHDEYGVTKQNTDFSQTHNGKEIIRGEYNTTYATSLNSVYGNYENSMQVYENLGNRENNSWQPYMTASHYRGGEQRLYHRGQIFGRTKNEMDNFSWGSNDKVITRPEINKWISVLYAAKYKQNAALRKIAEQRRKNEQWWMDDFGSSPNEY